MFVFREIWRALFSRNPRFEIRLFAPLPTVYFNCGKILKDVLKGLVRYHFPLGEYLQIQIWEYLFSALACSNLNLDCHIGEDFCQVKIFPSLVQQNTSICLVGVVLLMCQYI